MKWTTKRNQSTKPQSWIQRIYPRMTKKENIRSLIQAISPCAESRRPAWFLTMSGKTWVGFCLSVASAVMRRGLRKNADLCAGQEMESYAESLRVDFDIKQKYPPV